MLLHRVLGGGGVTAYPPPKPVPALLCLQVVDGPLALGGNVEPLLGAESRELSPEDETHEEEAVLGSVR